jgi:hypothetical protein
MTFWRKRKNQLQWAGKNIDSDFTDINKKEFSAIYRRQEIILKKLDLQEKTIQKQSKQIEGLLDALNNINSALESNNIVLQELVKSYKKGPDLLLN